MKRFALALAAFVLLASHASAQLPTLGAGAGGFGGGGVASSTWDFVTNCDCANVSSSNGGLTVTKSGAEGNSYIIGTKPISGVIYWEITTNSDAVNNNFTARLLRAGIALALVNCNHPATGLGGDSCSVGAVAVTDGSSGHPNVVYINFSTVADWNMPFASGSHLGFVVNTTTKKLWVTNDGTHWYGASAGAGTDNPCTPTGGIDITAIIAEGPIYPAVTVFTTAGGPSADQATYNPTAGSFTFTKPACATAIG